MKLKDVVKAKAFAVKKRFSPTIRQAQIDTVTKLVTGKNVLELAEEAKDVATEQLTNAEQDLEKKSDALEKAQVAHESAVITKDLRRRDFDTVKELLK